VTRVRSPATAIFPFCFRFLCFEHRISVSFMWTLSHQTCNGCPCCQHDRANTFFRTTTLMSMLEAILHRDGCRVCRICIWMVDFGFSSSFMCCSCSSHGYQQKEVPGGDAHDPKWEMSGTVFSRNEKQFKIIISSRGIWHFGWNLMSSRLNGRLVIASSNFKQLVLASPKYIHSVLLWGK
jgi:hypothetical protein